MSLPLLFISLVGSPSAVPPILALAAIGQAIGVRRIGERRVARATMVGVLIGALLCFVDARFVSTAATERERLSGAIEIALLFVCDCGFPLVGSAVGMAVARRRFPQMGAVQLWLTGVAVGLLIFVPAIVIGVSTLYTIHN